MGQLVNGEFISTVKPSGGGDYTSLSAWESDRQGNLVSSGHIEVAEVFGGDAGPVTIAGWTTDSNNYIHIRPNKNFIAGTKYGPHNAFINNSIGNAIHVSSVDYTIIEGLTIRSTASDDTIFYEAQDGGQFNKNWVWGGDGVRLEGKSAFSASPRNDTRSHSNIVLQGGDGATRAAFSLETSSSSSAVLRVFNNTVISGEDCIRKLNSNNTQPRNNYFHIATGETVYIGGTGNFSPPNDATSNAESTNPDLRNIAFDDPDLFVDPHNKDFALLSSAILRGSGQNFNEPGSFVFITEDIENEPRDEGTQGVADGTNDMGADQFFFAPGPFFVGGYIQSEPGGSASGFIGAYLESLPPLASGASGVFGGLIESIVPDNQFAGATLGAYMLVDSTQVGPTSFGGFVDSQPLTDAGTFIVGAITSGLFKDGPVSIGGYTFGEPVSEEFIETHARTLAKAKDSTTVDQKLEIDSFVVLKQIGKKNFSVKLVVSDTAAKSFNLKLDVEKNKAPPTVEILEIATSGGGFCPSGLVTVTASGFLGDADQWVSSYIDFGEPILPNGGAAPNSSISGFTGPPPWTASHCYGSSGLYSIVARGQDNQGMVGSDINLLNLASGLIAGVDYPSIDISGIPRMGTVPDALQVDFDVKESGNFSISSPSDPRLHWNFANREKSQLASPISFYHSPGLYAATARLRYKDANGNIIWTSDGLLIGFSR